MDTEDGGQISRAKITGVDELTCIGVAEGPRRKTEDEILAAATNHIVLWDENIIMEIEAKLVKNNVPLAAQIRNGLEHETRSPVLLNEALKNN